MWDETVDLISGFCLLFGACLSLSAVVGLLRFPDLMSRTHAATKPQVLGVLLVLVAVALRLGQWPLAITLLTIWCFQLLTVPVSAHLIARTAYRRTLGRDDTVEHSGTATPNLDRGEMGR